MTTAARPYVRDGIEFDQIAVRGIRVSGYHGVNANEREDGQLFLADVVVHVNTRTAAVGDDLSRSVNYSEVADRTAEILAGSPFKLIEAVAEHIARELLEIEGAECVDVTVHKPQAPLHVEFKDVTITIRRDLRDGSLSADKRIGSSAGFSDDPLDPGAGPARDIMDERPAQPVPAVIALGGNLGDVEPTFREALAALHRVPGVEVRAASPLVRSVPEGGADQPDYLNAVARIHTSLAPRQLLAACNGIEMLYGRDRTVPGSARTLDLDLITYDGVTGESPDLTLPHPRAHLRGFVLLPWAHMEPDATLEPYGRVADLARQAAFDGVTVVGPQWPHVPAPDALSPASAPSVPSAPAQRSAEATPTPRLEPEVADWQPEQPSAASPAPGAPEPSQGEHAPEPGPEHRPSAPSAPSQPGVPRRASFGVARQTPPADESGHSGHQ
ncbi:2-amino-4-hydroxy-6-hydroxymethyldihydropteridine diphosphokinase [Demequina muriae]|uniref:Bifunctional folate synthesis protein n=1 Tax=Demequina muriae TaxID=3051664 RepID=A0ABT8GFE7_9MICO|nr:2-amino-4-hydroxy-6-hydroxymethyldihydropteridine diphosphokinase [Demequina sp. EGI L300058]MDN4480157.1 2-amino-4-hydroxy-6-hydroxymethyldihydropteridine diphosphokinase [Demequina sp. EGI L300058]